MLLDLQAIIEVCYRKGRYKGDLDYRRDPDPPLSGPDNFHYMMPMEGADLEAARRAGKVRILGTDGQDYLDDEEDEFDEEPG